LRAAVSLVDLSVVDVGTIEDFATVCESRENECRLV